ncbi:MAG TPA: MFS transporter, partial [Rectinemataceae bacterium]|nr:MFS transporter [Rectinemataceae bacterium]
ALSNAAFFGAILFLPLWMQEVLGVSASSSGLAVTPMLLAYTLSSVAGGQLLGKLRSMRAYAILAGLVAVAGSFLLIRVDRGMGQLPVIIAMVILGVGLGANTPTLTIAAQNSVEGRYIGLATATNSFFRNLGSALGSAVMGSVFIRGLAAGLAGIDWGSSPEALRSSLQDPKVLMSPAALQAIASSVPDGFRQTMARILDQIAGSLEHGIKAVFVVMAAAAVLGLVPLVLLRGRRARPPA